MAVDIKQIFEVDTSVDNLKTLREEIRLLKKELENLAIGSKEYETVSDQLWAKQSRLNEVIKDTKRPVEDAEGSFNSWLKKLKELKDEWKATGDEMERGKLTVQINEVKAKINEANESIGNFQHNVGNYSNSIIDAFQKMGISVTSLTAPLKKVGVDIEGVDTSVKLLVGTFKTFSGQNLAALKEGFSGLSSSVGGFIKSLTGIKAAVAATGLGVLLVLIGELIAHWDDLTGAIDRWVTSTNKGVTTAQQLEAAFSEFNYQLQLNARLMQAAGESEEDVIKAQIESIKQKYAETEAIAYQNTMLAANAKWIWTRTAALKGEKEAIEQMKKLNEDLKKLEDDLKVAQVRSEAAKKKNAEATKGQTKATKELIDTERELDALMREQQRAQADAEKEVQDGLQKALDLQQAEIDKRKSAMELEMEDYEQKKAILEEYHLSTEELEQNHWERMMEIRNEVEQAEYEELERQRAIKKKQDEKDKADYEKLMKARKDATMNMANGTASIFKQLSRTVGESTKLGKGFSIAAATIDTIASAVAGFRAGMNQWADAGPMAWMAPVQAALNATMALTAGFAEVQKIRNVDTSGNASGGGGSTALAMAIPNIEGLSSPVDYTRQVTTETEKEEMNQGNRVYILESDIQQSNNRVKVREEETTF